jgi:ubiquinone biosynthesis protein UbiJ
MFHTLTSSLRAAFVERCTLLINHVIAAEPAATERLRSHCGRNMQLQFDGWPTLLPQLPELAFRVTPAGLLEWRGLEPSPDPDLSLRLDASNPALALAQWASGERPRVEVQGDAQFAADLSWLMDNLRWDIQDDLAGLVGQAPAHEIARIGKQLAGGLREAVRSLSGWATRAAAGEPGPGAR